MAISSAAITPMPSRPSSDFVQRFPTDRMTPEANYWLAESLFQRQRYQDAAEAYLVVTTKFEKATRAPDALLRLGQSLAAIEPEGNGLRVVCRGQPEISEFIGWRETERRAGTEACPLLTMPVSAEEAERLFGLLSREKALVLAVSGGPDSTALMMAGGAMAKIFASSRRSSSPSRSITGCGPKAKPKLPPSGSYRSPLESNIASCDGPAANRRPVFRKPPVTRAIDCSRRLRTRLEPDMSSPPIRSTTKAKPFSFG